MTTTNVALSSGGCESARPETTLRCRVVALSGQTQVNRDAKEENA
jgi:hypothetical protein